MPGLKIRIWPMTCLRAELINNNLSSDHKTDVNIHDDLNVIQDLLVMLGSVHIAIVIQDSMTS